MAKKKIEVFSQCRFVEEREDDVRVETVGYIDAKEASVGKVMTLKGVEGIWKIEQAGRPGPPPHWSGGSMD